MVQLAKGPGLVGRAAELGQLDAAFGRVGAGQAAAVVIGGEAGIGKTELIGAFAASTSERGGQVLTGACLEFGNGGLPYAPFVEAIRALVRSVEPGRLPALLGPGRAELSRLLPELDSGASGPPVLDELDRSAQARLFERILGVVERLARNGPVVLVIEDIQWSDQSTRDLLAFLLRGLRTTPVLFVVSTRTEELAHRHPVLPFLAELERDDDVERLELKPFDREEIAAQVEAIVGTRPTTELVDRIRDRTGGNPFYVEQLAERLAEDGDEQALPPLLGDVLRARLGSLSDAAHEVLRGCAAAGRRVDDALLADVLELPARDVEEALREAIERGILVDAMPSRGVDGGYAFRHAILQEVVDAELLTAQRRRLHARFARALSARGEVGGVPVEPADLAAHWDAAGERPEALSAYVAAGRAAERVYAHAEAAHDYWRALALWQDVPDADERAGVDRAELLHLAADSAVLGGEVERSVELGRAAIDALAETDPADAERAGFLHRRLRWYLWQAGDRAAAAAAVAEALRLYPADRATAGRARALADLAGLQLLGGDFVAAAGSAEQALAIARATDAPAEVALSLGVLGWVRAVLGDVDAGIATFREGLAIAEQLGGPEGIAFGYANLAAMLDRVGRTEESLAAATEGFEIARRLGVARTYGGVMLGHAGKALYNLGRWDEADRVIDDGLSRDPVGRPAIWLRINRARLDANRGRPDDARARLDEARANDDGLGGSEYRTALLAADAELAVLEGRSGDVRTAAAAGLRLAADDTGPPDPSLAWLAALALRSEADEAERARARRDDAALAEATARAQAIRRPLDQFEAAGAARARAAPGAGRTAALLSLCRAEYTRVEGRPDPSAWSRTAAGFDAIGRPFPAAYARFREAEATLESRGSRAAAEDALRWAHGAATDLAAAPLRGDIELLARQARLHLAPTGTSTSTAAVAAADAAGDPTIGRLGLTTRELEVLRLVAGGWTNQQIADALYISRKTASVHVSNILDKLGVANRVEAAAVAHRLGLAADAPPPGGVE